MQDISYIWTLNKTTQKPNKTIAAHPFLLLLKIA